MAVIASQYYGFGNFILAGGGGIEVTPLPDEHTVVIKATEKLDEIICEG